MKIVFTSCMDADRAPAQPIWDRIREEAQPDVLMLLGDQIYMDWGDLGASNWRQDYYSNGLRMLKKFSSDMHSRYAQQWAVASFRRLLGSLGSRDASHLLITWDDHDFAWNNSLGMDRDDPSLKQVYRHGVPLPVKQRSHALFRQFEQQLRTGDLSSDDYPPPPTDDPPTTDLFWSGRLGGPDGPEALLLDSRSHRTPRQGQDPSIAGPTLIGGEATGRLLTAVSQPKGLLIVASGTPMQHNYVFSSQQDWRGDPPLEPGYPEYEQLTGQSRRPVLFLSGEIHRNAWSGRLPMTDPPGTASRIVQLLSSGAAIDGPGRVYVAPSYGELHVRLDGMAAEIGVALWARSKEGHWRHAPSMGEPLRCSAHDWEGALLGEAWSEVDAALDEQALNLLHFRPPKNPLYDVLEIKDLPTLDAMFLARCVDSAQPAQAMRLLDTKRGLEPLLLTKLQRPKDAIRETFERAHALGRPVVLFVHGVNKSLGDAVRQCHALRRLYKVEPVLVAWEAGNPAKVLNLWPTQEAACIIARSLAGLLGAFNEQAKDYPNTVAVVLARSAGSLALNEAALDGSVGSGPSGLSKVSRVVLSAPLLQWRSFHASRGLESLKTAVVVTRNRNDRALKYADWLDGPFTHIMGLEPGSENHRHGATVLDFSDCKRVGGLHDYLMFEIHPNQHEVNRKLLTERVFVPASLGELLQDRGNGAFDVR